MEVMTYNSAPVRSAVLGRVIASGLTLIEGGQLRIAGLSLTVRAGEVVGLTGGDEPENRLCLGLLAGLIRPTFGVLRLCGATIRSTPPPFLVGTNLDPPPEGPGLTCGEWLQHRARQTGYCAAEARARSAEILDSLAMSARAGTRISELSPQERAVFTLGVALVADPPVVIARHPLKGLDSRYARVVRSLLRRWSVAGKAVLIAADLADLAEGDCDRLYLLSDGHIAARASLQHMDQLLSGHERASDP